MGREIVFVRRRNRERGIPCVIVANAAIDAMERRRVWVREQQCNAFMALDPMITP